MPSAAEVEAAPKSGELKGKIVRGGIVFGVLVAVVIAIVAAVPGLDGVRSALVAASPWWIALACVIQLVGTAGGVVFVQAVFEELPRKLSWWQGSGMQGADAVVPTVGSTGVSYWSVNALGWETSRFAKRTAVMIIAPAAPNVLLIILVGVGMGLGLFAGPSGWWLTWLPAAIAFAAVVVVVAAAVWAKRLAGRVRSRRLGEAISVVATGVTGTVAILRRRSWRVLGTWVDELASIGALWASMIAVGDHLPFAVVAMAFLIGQIAQVVPVPGGIGSIDAAVTGALVVYGAPTEITAAGELIAHALALLIPLAVGAIALIFLPREIAKARTRRDRQAAATSPPVPVEG